jgi:hypothetical protein
MSDKSFDILIRTKAELQGAQQNRSGKRKRPKFRPN